MRFSDLIILITASQDLRNVPSMPVQPNPSTFLSNLYVYRMKIWILLYDFCLFYTPRLLTNFKYAQVPCFLSVEMGRAQGPATALRDRTEYLTILIYLKTICMHIRYG